MAVAARGLESEAAHDGSHDLVALERPDDDARRQRLRRNKRMATGLLVVMAALLAWTETVREPAFWVLLLRAGAEAGVVGGLADWFAVTAIFRRPLGLPIPHTGIVAAQKERIGLGIGGFVERNFLAPALIAERLRAIDPAARLAGWLSAEDNAAAVADRLVASLPTMIGTVEDRGLREFVGRTIGEELRGVELAPVLGRMLHVLTSTGEYDVLFDKALDAAGGMIRANAPRIQAIVERHSSWWVPKAIDRKITQTILQGLEDLVGDLRRPESEGRREFRQATEGLVAELLESAEHRARVEEVKARLLAHPDVQAWLASVWDQVRGAVLGDLAQPAESSRTRSTLVSLLASCGQALADDPTLRERLNGALTGAIVGTAASLRGEIGGYIADVVRGWDSRTIADRLELAIGTDLQYVRVNGTLVGGCVGCVLFLLSRLLG